MSITMIGSLVSTVLLIVVRLMWRASDEFLVLVDTVSVVDKLQAIPGDLEQVSVDPLLGTTYTEDTMKFVLKLGHKLLQNGYLTIALPPELKFVNSPACLAFSDGIDQDATCAFEQDSEGEYTGMFTVLQGFKQGDYD